MFENLLRAEKCEPTKTIEKSTKYFQVKHDRGMMSQGVVLTLHRSVRYINGLLCIGGNDANQFDYKLLYYINNI